MNQLSMLVVDDSSAMRSIVCDMLRSFGVVYIDVASSGEEAFAKARSGQFAIIISDWNMAPVDGSELLRLVRPFQTARWNRFVFMTTESAWGHKTTARIDGADDFLVKPFRSSALKASLEKIAARM